MNYTTSNCFKKGYWVYIHTCPNGKKYVGCTTGTLLGRWGEGKGYRSTFKSDIRKYGWDNIKHEAWELTSKSEMYYAEKYLIAFYDTTNPEKGYNRTTGGKNPRFSEQAKKDFRSPRYVVKLPNGTVKVLTRNQATLFYRNYYLKYPGAPRVDLEFLGLAEN